MPARSSRAFRALSAAVAMWFAFAASPARADGRPQGALSGKIVYLHAGHGWTADNLAGGGWYTQRGESFEIVEDLLNADMHAFQAESLWNAGATIVPLRPIGHQPIEVVVDNDDPGVEFVGAWSVSGSPVYFGSPGDEPYRFANTSATETAVARFRPDLPQAGFYPVYTWVLGDANRTTQLYRVHHTGGVTEVTVDHRMVGGGLVYLGTYRFDAGTAGFVEISNRSDVPGVVIADMIRFGNGMGDIDRGAGPSGRPRADEAALYWIEAHAGQGVASSAWRTSSDDGSSTVSTPPKWAARMNLAGAGSPADRVFVSHHSNAGGGSARGVIALYNGNNNPATATPLQFELAFALAAEINDDLVAQDAGFEHPWATRAVLTLDRTDFEFGEINNLFINDEFDATIVERAFHDNRLDAELMRDADVCEAVARATTQGLVRYFNLADGGTTPLAFAPVRVEGVRTRSNADGSVTLIWSAPPANAWAGDAPTAYRVQTSADGYGFDAGIVVPSSAFPGATVTGLPHGLRFFRVVAVNAGGWSPPSRVVAATVGGSAADVLIVDGFDRVDRFQNVREPYFSGVIDRVRPRHQNAFDYAVPAARAVAAAGLRVDTAPNEALASGGVSLAAYDAVVWILGEESLTDDTFSAIEQFEAAGYVAGGGNLFVSGSEIAWDLGFFNNGLFFLNNVLGAEFAADDAGTYSVRGAAGSPFAGLEPIFDDGTLFYDAEFPDVLTPEPPAFAAFEYAGGLGGVAGVAKPAAGGEGATVMLGFPFETITDEAARQDVMAAVLGFFGLLDACPADLTGDGLLDLADVTAFVGAFVAAQPPADLNADGVYDLSDIAAFVDGFISGCP